VTAKSNKGVGKGKSKKTEKNTEVIDASNKKEKESSPK